MSQVPPPPSSPPAWGGGDGGQHVAPTNAPAGVAALIFGIIGLTVIPFVASIVALVLGYQSRSAARAEPHRYTDQLGQVGRVLGWIGVALSVGALVLVAIVLAFLFVVRGA